MAATRQSVSGADLYKDMCSVEGLPAVSIAAISIARELIMDDKRGAYDRDATFTLSNQQNYTV